MANPRLEIQFGADLREIKTALNSLGKDLQGFKKSAEGAGQRMGAGLEAAKRAAYQLGAVLGAALSVRQLAAMSDEAANLNARLKLATKTTEQFNRAQAGTFEIAQRTRTSWKATAELYARIERSTRELGVNQETVLQLTESINQAAQISGGGQGAEAALFQLSQGLASGQLRGEELNSVLEQTPRLAQAVADGMGIPIGALRKYAQEGKLSAQEVLRALLNQKDVLAEEFAKMPATISGGFTQVRNAFLQYIATSQEAGTAAASVASALKTLAENLPAIISATLRLGQVVAAYVVTFKLLPALYQAVIALSGTLATRQLTLAAAFTAAGTAGQRAMFAIRSAASLALAAFAGWQIGTLLREQFQEVELFGIAMAAGLHGIAVRIQHYFETAGTRIRLALAEAFNWVIDKSIAMNRAITGVLERLPGRVGKAYREAGDQAKGMLEGMKADTAGLSAEVAGMDAQLAASLANVAQGYSDLADAAIAARQQAGKAAAGDVGLGGNPDPAGVASAFRGDLELLRDSIDRALKELDRLYEEGEIGLREYFTRKAALQTAAIDAAIAQAEQERKVATTQEAQAKALVEIEKLQRDRAEVGPRVAREQAKAEEALVRKLEDVKAALAELTGDSAAGARLAIARERAALLKEFADDPAAKAVIGRLFDLKTVRANLDAIRDQVNTTVGDLRSTEALLAAQQEAGQVSPTAAEEQLQQVRERSIAQLKEYRAALVALAESSKGDPEVLRQLQAVDTELARVSANADQLTQKMQDQAVQSLAGFFSDLATGAKSLSEAFTDFVRSFVQGIAQMIAQELALKAVRGILSAFGGGSVPVQHAGGMAGSGPRRSVDAGTLALFAGAPRFHSGGLPGLRADEVPSILQRGEEVLAKDDPRNVMNGGGRTGAGTGTRVINVIDPSLVQDYLDSPAGEEAILNVIGRNPGRVKQVVG